MANDIDLKPVYVALNVCVLLVLPIAEAKQVKLKPRFFSHSRLKHMLHRWSCSLPLLLVFAVFIHYLLSSLFALGQPRSILHDPSALLAPIRARLGGSPPFSFQ